MKIIVWGCLIAQMNRFDALITTQKPPALCKVPFLKKSRKIAQNDNFKKNTIFFLSLFLDFLKKWDLAESWGFLCCNQCIKTLHLSYQTPLYDDFHFSTQMGFWKIFVTRQGGSTINFENFENYFYFQYSKRHLKPPAPEQVWNSPPPKSVQCRAQSVNCGVYIVKLKVQSLE